MIGNKIITRYNHLLSKFSRDDEFIELIQLVRNYYDMCSVEHGNKTSIYNIDNPYDRLLMDLILLEDETKKGE